MSPAERSALMRVSMERMRQDLKWGIQDHNDEHWCVILGEEFGEVCRAIFEGKDNDIEAELVQVAAVAVAWLECKYRRGKNGR